jgi:hypothetical protein
MTRVQKVLEKEFSPKEILLESERQQKIHGLLEKHFNAQDRRRILTIFPLTPLEKRVIIDEDPEGSIQLPVKKSLPSVSRATRRIQNGVVNRRRSAGNGRVVRR